MSTFLLASAVQLDLTTVFVAAVADPDAHGLLPGGILCRGPRAASRPPDHHRLRKVCSSETLPPVVRYFSLLGSLLTANVFAGLRCRWAASASSAESTGLKGERS